MKMQFILLELETGSLLVLCFIVFVSTGPANVDPRSFGMKNETR